MGWLRFTTFKFDSDSEEGQARASYYVMRYPVVDLVVDLVSWALYCKDEFGANHEHAKNHHSDR